MGVRRKTDSLKEAFIDEALAIIEKQGVEALSLREVARRLNVSHQAPYKHFATREHILAAVLARCYGEFAGFLEARPRSPDDWTDLENMGLAYLQYARENPLKYRLMFNSAIPDPADHPLMVEKAEHAFDILHRKLTGMRLRQTYDPIKDAARHDALFIWSCLHGLASLSEADATRNLSLSEDDKRVAVRNAMQRMSLALVPDQG
jgi:AcrR family transcriptional regulator